MKKFLALVLCLMMACTLSAAVAESADATESADVTESSDGAESSNLEELFDGAWVQFEDGFELYLPADWVEFETTEEMNAKGIFFIAGTEDMSYSCTLAWQPLEAECTLEELQPTMAAKYPDAEVVEVNGVGLIAYTDAENNLLNCVAMDAAEPGFYLFAFSPADDEEFQNLAGLIAASIRNM